MPSPDGPTLSFTSEQQEVPPVLGVWNQSCEANINRLIMYSRFVGIAYIMFSFLAPKGALETQMFVCLSFCHSVSVIMLYSFSKGFLRVPKSA